MWMGGLVVHPLGWGEGGGHKTVRGVLGGGGLSPRLESGVMAVRGLALAAHIKTDARQWAIKDHRYLSANKEAAGGCLAAGHR